MEVEATEVELERCVYCGSLKESPCEESGGYCQRLDDLLPTGFFFYKDGEPIL